MGDDSRRRVYSIWSTLSIRREVVLAEFRVQQLGQAGGEKVIGLGGT